MADSGLGIRMTHLPCNSPKIFGYTLYLNIKIQDTKTRKYHVYNVRKKAAVMKITKRKAEIINIRF